MRKVLVGAGLLLGVMEFVNAFVIDFPLAAIVMGAAFVASSLWALRGGRASTAIVGLLCLFDMITVAMIWAGQPDAPLGTVLTFLSFEAVGLVGIVAAVARFLPRRAVLAVDR